MASALIQAIKVAGLVLVADTTSSAASIHTDLTLAQPSGSKKPAIGVPPPQPGAADGVNGVLDGSGVLRFYDTIDV